MQCDASSLEEGKLAAWLAFPCDIPRIYDYLSSNRKRYYICITAAQFN